MDPNNDIFKLQLITLFDSLSFGLLYAFLSPYLIVIGGDNVTVGWLTVTTLISQLMSSDVVRDMINYQGRKAALYTIFNIATVSHALLFLTNSCWFTIVARCIFAATNQSGNIIKSMLLQKVTSEETQSQLVIYNILSSSGYILGPIIGGCVFDTTFGICCVMACFFTMLNIGLLTTVDMDEEDEPTEGSDFTVMKRTVENVKDAILDFQKSDYHSNWDIISMKYFFTASTTIFFSKYTQILKHNFDADSIQIGYTTSYMNCLMFIGIYCATKLKQKLNNIPMIFIVNCAYVLLCISMLAACYSPVYSCYAIMCIFIVLSRTVLIHVWDDFVSERRNGDLTRIGDSVSIGAGVTVPILFGILCNYIGHYAVIIFSVLPLVGSLIIINRYSYVNYNKEK